MMLLFWLLVGHALCDYPLQGDFLARAKNHRAPLPGVPWYQCLIAHSLIQAGMVTFVTHSQLFGIAEFALHFVTDWMKSDGWIDYNQDQAIHVLCKIAYVVTITFSVGR